MSLEQLSLSSAAPQPAPPALPLQPFLVFNPQPAQQHAPQFTNRRANSVRKPALMTRGGDKGSSRLKVRMRQRRQRGWNDNTHAAKLFDPRVPQLEVSERQERAAERAKAARDQHNRTHPGSNCAAVREVQLLRQAKAHMVAKVREKEREDQFDHETFPERRKPLNGTRHNRQHTQPADGKNVAINHTTHHNCKANHSGKGGNAGHFAGDHSACGVYTTQREAQPQADPPRKPAIEGVSAGHGMDKAAITSLRKLMSHAKLFQHPASLPPPPLPLSQYYYQPYHQYSTLVPPSDNFDRNSSSRGSCAGFELATSQAGQTDQRQGQGHQDHHEQQHKQWLWPENPHHGLLSEGRTQRTGLDATKMPVPAPASAFAIALGEEEAACGQSANHPTLCTPAGAVRFSVQSPPGASTSAMSVDQHHQHQWPQPRCTTPLRPATEATAITSSGTAATMAQAQLQALQQHMQNLERQMLGTLTADTENAAGKAVGIDGCNATAIDRTAEALLDSVLLDVAKERAAAQQRRVGARAERAAARAEAAESLAAVAEQLAAMHEEQSRVQHRWFGSAEGGHGVSEGGTDGGEDDGGGSGLGMGIGTGMARFEAMKSIAGGGVSNDDGVLTLPVGMRAMNMMPIPSTYGTSTVAVGDGNEVEEAAPIVIGGDMTASILDGGCGGDGAGRGQTYLSQGQQGMRTPAGKGAGAVSSRASGLGNRAGCRGEGGADPGVRGEQMLDHGQWREEKKDKEGPWLSEETRKRVTAGKKAFERIENEILEDLLEDMAMEMEETFNDVAKHVLSEV